MRKELIKKTTVTVDELRKNRNLMPNILGEISSILSGNVTDIYGDVTGICGDVTDIRGDIDECELTDIDRENGVSLSQIIKEGE